MKKVIIYEKGYEDDIAYGLTKEIEEYYPDILDDDRKIFGNDSCWDIDEFYHYELMPDGTVQVNYYEVPDDLEDYGNIDYENPYRTEETDLAWRIEEDNMEKYTCRQFIKKYIHAIDNNWFIEYEYFETMEELEYMKTHFMLNDYDTYDFALDIADYLNENHIAFCTESDDHNMFVIEYNENNEAQFVKDVLNHYDEMIHNRHDRTFTSFLHGKFYYETYKSLCNKYFYEQNGFGYIDYLLDAFPNPQKDDFKVMIDQLYRTQQIQYAKWIVETMVDKEKALAKDFEYQFYYQYFIYSLD